MKKQTRHLIGILLGILSAVCSAIIAIEIGHQKQIPTTWVLLIQSLLAFIVSSVAPTTSRPRCSEDSKRQRLKTSRYPMHLLRAVAGLSIYWFYYQSLKSAPKVDCSLLLNTAPVLIPLVCILVFRERVPRRTWVGVIAGFVGISVVLAPELTFDAVDFGYVYALIAGLCFAISTIVVRSLNETEPVSTTVSFYNLHCVAVLCIVLVLAPSRLTWESILTCIAVGIAFCVKQYAITFSIKFASATIAAVLNFTTIPILAVYSVMAEGASLSVATVVGTSLVGLGMVAILFPSAEAPVAPEPIDSPSVCFAKEG